MTPHKSSVAVQDAKHPHQHATARDALTAQAREWWKLRTARERNLLTVCAVVVAVALIWTVALKPAADDIRRLHEQLPRLRTEAAQVDALVLEAQALQRRQSGQVDAGAMTQAVRDDLRRAGLAATSTLAESTPQAGAPRTEWEIILNDAGAAQVMDWLAGISYRLRLELQTVELARSRIDGRDHPGHVSGRVILQQVESSQ